MPRYDYTCQKCGTAFEEQLPIATAMLARTRPCQRPGCVGQADRQTFYAPAAHFKGDGWETNSHKKGKP